LGGAAPICRRSIMPGGSPNWSDESEIPLDYKTAAIKLPARTWESLLDNLDLEMRAHITDQATRSDSVDKGAVKAAIADKNEIPGVTLTVGKFSLVRK
jgi:hypothetical protein